MRLLKRLDIEVLSSILYIKTLPEFLVQPYEKGDSANTISFLKYFIKQRPNSRLTIVWDGAKYHKLQQLREYLELVNKAKYPDKWQINCILFAPNAPNKIQ
jgi:hypothetical protein